MVFCIKGLYSTPGVSSHVCKRLIYFNFSQELHLITSVKSIDKVWLLQVLLDICSLIIMDIKGAYHNHYDYCIIIYPNCPSFTLFFQSLVREPFIKRRALLRQSFMEKEGEFVFACSLDSDNTESIAEFLEQSIRGVCLVEGGDVPGFTKKVQHSQNIYPTKWIINHCLPSL